MPTDHDLDAMNALLARNWWAIVLRGALAIVFGVIALIVPAAAMLSLALVFAAYLLIDGIFAIVAAVRAARSHERWGMLLVEGLLNIAMGAIAGMFPVAAVFAFVFVTAIWALLSGAAMVAASFRLHITHGRWWLAFGGIASIAWGVMLLIAPMIGAVVLTWWLGAYAIVFGVLLLVVGFRLRGQHMTGGAIRHA